MVIAHALIAVLQITQITALAGAVKDTGNRAALGSSAVSDSSLAPAAPAVGTAEVASGADSTVALPPADSLLGRSGKLRARFLVTARHSLALPILRHFFGDSAASHPGIYPWTDSLVGGGTFSLITMLPFGSKSRGRVGDYRVGWWPAERHRRRSDAYANPDGFIRVTADNQDTPVSEHFRLRDFLTHDQQDVWPKYIVLREALLDKLELIIDDLAAHGRPNARLVILSGFRTPAYNALGVGLVGGRARDSRHQFGDAADVFVDDDGDGVMDDLNGDGRIDSRDARLILASVDRVEAAHPELTGGAGVYRGTRAHGPFLHVDVRGEAVRWAVEEPRHRKSGRRHGAFGACGSGTHSTHEC